MKTFLSTRDVAELLGVNEKMVYSLVSEKGLPATKVTGKWLFPLHLVEQWLERETINHPDTRLDELGDSVGLLVVAGSNDILLDRALSLYMEQHPDILSVFGNVGSMGGIRALQAGQCHMAASHLAEGDGQEFNFSFAVEELDRAPAVVNFCKREQGILVAPGNPHGVKSVADIAKKKLTMVNRKPGTGTRLVFDRALAAEKVDLSTLNGYDTELGRHMDVALEVATGRADVAPAVRVVAGLFGLDFVPLHWERFDLLIDKDCFFERRVQEFLGMLQEPAFQELASDLQGYDLTMAGKMVYPGN